MKRKRGHPTYAEVEESEADLKHFRSWLAKIAKRDYFLAPKSVQARKAVEHCGQELVALEKAVLAMEGSSTAWEALGVTEVLKTFGTTKMDYIKENTSL